ncbi:FCD domain-containing protein [Sphingobium salicis]|uniref:FCD domain-containing protein n=1 Tax=unclassified Sphingobium TaxID=2611147 RepID=UPI003C2E00AF
MIQNHADRPLANLGCKLVRRLAHRRPFLSGVRASGNPGAVHLLDPELLTWAFSSAPDREFLHDIFELQMIIQPRAARLAAERRSQRDLTELDHQLRAMGVATPAPPLLCPQAQFHARLHRSIGNDALANLGAGLISILYWIIPEKPCTDVTLGNYTRLLEAVRSRCGSEADLAMGEIMKGYEILIALPHVPFKLRPAKSGPVAACCRK